MQHSRILHVLMYSVLDTTQGYKMCCEQQEGPAYHLGRHLLQSLQLEWHTLVVTVLQLVACATGSFHNLVISSV